MPDINYWLGQKYGILQQQADATSAGAKAALQNADTATLTGTAAAALDKVRAGILPKQSAAEIAQSGAQTALLAEQAKYFGPTAEAAIGNTNAQTGLINTNRKVTAYEGLGDTSGLAAPVRDAVNRSYTFGNIAPTTSLGTGIRLAPIAPGESPEAYRRRVGASYLDQINP